MLCLYGPLEPWAIGFVDEPRPHNAPCIFATPAENAAALSCFFCLFVAVWFPGHPRKLGLDLFELFCVVAGNGATAHRQQTPFQSPAYQLSLLSLALLGRLDCLNQTVQFTGRNM